MLPFDEPVLRGTQSMMQTTTPSKPMDRRRLNNPHAVVESAGREAARNGQRVYSCPYRHPAMRASWLKGFAKEQQLTLDLH